MGFSRQEYWSELPFPPPGDLPHPGVQPGSPSLQADSLPLSHLGRPGNKYIIIKLSPWLSPASETSRTCFLFSPEEPSLPSSADCPTCAPCPAGPLPSEQASLPPSWPVPWSPLCWFFWMWEGRKAKQAPPCWRKGKGWVLRWDKIVPKVFCESGRGFL